MLKLNSGFLSEYYVLYLLQMTSWNIEKIISIQTLYKHSNFKVFLLKILYQLFNRRIYKDNKWPHT